MRNLVLFDEYRCEEDNPNKFTQSSLRRLRRLQRALHGGPTKKLKDMRKWTIGAIEANRTDLDMTDNILSLNFSILRAADTGDCTALVMFMTREIADRRGDITEYMRAVVPAAVMHVIKRYIDWA